MTLSSTESDTLLKLVSRLSHDLRGSVRAMAQIVDWIEEDLRDNGHGTSGGIDDYLTLLKSRSTRLTMLITDLTTLADVGLEPRLFDGDWDALLDRVLIKTPLRAAFEITTDFQATPKLACSDLDVLIDVLVSNAIKHNTRGSGHIQISTAAHNNACLLVLQDDGPGIPDDRIEEAMGMLSTLARKDTVEGSGLGFSIAQHIVSEAGGSFSIGRPSSGQGCKVAITLPIAKDLS